MIGRGKGGRRDLTVEDQTVLARIRKCDDLRIAAHEARDLAMIEAAQRGINYEIIGAAAGGIKSHTVSYITNHPFDRRMNNHKSGPKSYKRKKES